MPDESEIRRIIPLIEAVIEGQRRSTAQVSALVSRNDLVDAAYDRLSKQINRLQESQASLGTDLRGEIQRSNGEIQRLNGEIQRLNNRVDAVLIRLDEMEGQIDRLSSDLRGVRSELVGQYNEILNALQIGLNAKSDLEEVTARVERLEQAVGL